MSPSASGLLGVFARLRRYLLRRAGLVLGIWFAVGAGTVLILAWLLAGGGGWRQGTWSPFLLDLALAGLIALTGVLFRLARSRWLHERRLAGAVEDAAGLSSGTLLGSLELARSLPGGVSPSLAERAQRRILDGLSGSDARLAGRLDRQASAWQRRGFGSVSVVAPLVALMVVASPARSARAWGGLLHPVSLLARPVLPPLSVAPGSVEVLRGAPLAVQVGAPGREVVTLGWQAAGDIARSETLVITGDRAGFVFPAVPVETEYWAEAPDGAKSERFTITPVDPLLVSEVRVSLTFPAYTGRFPEEYRGDVPALEVPVGSRVRVSGRASRALSAGGLVRLAEDGSDREEAATFQVNGSAFEGDWVPGSGGRFRWAFRDEEGAPAEIAPSPLDLTLVTDAAPDIAILIPGRDTVLPLSLQQPLVMEAGDDYGVRRIELVVRKATAFGERLEPVVQSLDVGDTRGALVRPVMDFSAWELLPGDTILYLARAIDNAPVAQVSETPEYALRMPTRSELRREAQRQLEEAAKELANIADRAQREAEATRDLEREVANRPQERGREDERRREREARVGFEEREDVEQALERQEAMLADVDSLEAELNAMAQDAQEAGLGDAELRRGLEELQDLLRDIASDDLRERLDGLQRSLDQMDQRRAREALRELSQDEEAFRARLEEALERFRRVAMEQDFRATTSEAEELAQRERALSEALREGSDPERRAGQQEDLRERAEALQERMERLRERLDQSGEADASDKVGEAGERTEQAQENMKRAERQSRASEPQEAGDAAEAAADRMDEVADQLEDAQSEMAQRLMDAMQQALAETAGHALSLAREQARVRESMRGAGRDAMAELRGDEAALLQGVRNLADNLSLTAQVAQGDTRGLSEQIGEAMDALRRTVEAMEGQRGRTPSPFAAAETAVEALNEVAMMAMASAEQAGQAAQGQGSQQLMKQLEQLAQQQRQLNDQTGQLVPMELGQTAMGRQLEQVAQGEGQIADELREMSQQPGSEDQTLGDLEAMVEEARRLAEALGGGRLTPETRRRQERLFHRLLDAGRSLEKDEESEERESTAPGAFERPDVLPLSPEALGALRFELPPAEVLRRLSPARRQMVLEYFERLNRARSGGPGGGNR